MLSKTSRHISLALSVLALTLVLVGVGPAGAESKGNGGLGQARSASVPHSKTHVLVKLEDASDAESTVGMGFSPVGHGWFRVPVPRNAAPLGWARALASRDGVVLAELDLEMSPLQEASPPFAANDPLYTAGYVPDGQWHLHAVEVAAAWRTTVGEGVIVAVLDSGVDNGPDGFQRPFVDEYDAVSNLAFPGAAADSDGHGSHVAGTIGQHSGNGFRGAGMAPGAQIMPIRVFGSDGMAEASHVARGIDWAREHGARVINLSLGCDCPGTSILDEAITRARAAGIIIVGAVGNSASSVFYPASHPEVLGVGATTFSGGVASYSAWGVGLDLVAPGGDKTAPIWQEANGVVQGSSGTSMAAAHVSGAVALLEARFPTAHFGQISAALLCSASDLGPDGWDNTSGAGLLDVGAAVDQLALFLQTGSLGCESVSGGTGTMGTVEPTTGIWRLYEAGAEVALFYYGVPGDVGFMGDWDCDGVGTPGLYRQSDGFVYLRNSNTQGVADVSFFFGNPGDVPLAGDFDGDGCDTLSLYRPSEQRFYVINRLGSGDGGLGAADYWYGFGNPGDVAFVGDWNGDGVDTAGLRRPSDGVVYMRDSNTTGVADVGFLYGDPGDLVFAGDWDGDGDDSLGLYRPGTGVAYLRNTNTTGTADQAFFVGFGMQPVGGDF